MLASSTMSVDFIEELRLRRWALENYVPAERRDRGWHPVILDEMRRKDHDNRSNDTSRHFNPTERH